MLWEFSLALLKQINEGDWCVIWSQKCADFEETIRSAFNYHFKRTRCSLDHSPIGYPKIIQYKVKIAFSQCSQTFRNHGHIHTHGLVMRAHDGQQKDGLGFNEFLF